MNEPLDDQKLDALRAWGERLAEEDRDEIRAAGRAILVLIAEVERLRLVAMPADDLDAEPDLQSGLRDRLLAQFTRR